jgi:DNA primase
MSEVFLSRIPEALIQQVLDSADIVDLVSEYLTLKKAGAHYKGLCPFHQEKTPSFTVNPSMQIFKCFGCGKGGNAVGFLMETEGLAFPQAVRQLAQRVGVEIPDERDTRDPAQVSIEERVTAITRAALEFYRNNFQREIHQDTAIARYVEDRKVPSELHENFRLGWSSEAWQEFTHHGQDLGFTDHELVESGLVLRSEKNGRLYDRYRGRLIFPIRNVSGAPIGFGGRIIRKDDDQPKYINSPETSIYHKGRSLYGLYEAKNSIRLKKTAVLVEGYMDLISLHAAGIKHVAASLGTALTQSQAILLRRFAERVIFLYDGDAAGQKAMARGASVLLSAGLDLRVCQLPEGMDPDDVIQAEGSEVMADRLDAALPYFQYRIQRFKKTEDQSTPAEYREFVQGMASDASEVDDLISRHQLFAQISRASGLPAHEIQVLADDSKKRQRRQADLESRRKVEHAPVDLLDLDLLNREQKRELQLFRLFVRNPKCRDRITEELDLEQVHFPLFREAFVQAFRAHLGDGSVESWVHACDNLQIRDLALKAIVDDPLPGDEQEMTDLMDRLGESLIRQRLREIQALQRNPDLDEKEIRRLLMEFDDLRKQLRS